MPFKYIGKNKLLRTLKMQMNNPDIWFKDVQYYREELYNSSKKEMVVFIDNDTHYEVINEYEIYEQKITLYYSVIKAISPNNYRVEQKIILKESEDN